MSDMTGGGEKLLELARELALTAPEDIDCEETLRRVAAYLEALPAEAGLPPELEAVRLHLAECPPCAEELEALIETMS